MGVSSERTVAAWAESMLQDRLNNLEEPACRTFQGVLESHNVIQAFPEFELLNRNYDSVYLNR